MGARLSKNDLQELREKARAHADVALAALIQVCMEGTSDAARVSAATAILDRGYGKPVQVHQDMEEDDKYLELKANGNDALTSAIASIAANVRAAEDIRDSQPEAAE